MVIFLVVTCMRHFARLSFLLLEQEKRVMTIVIGHLRKCFMKRGLG